MVTKGMLTVCIGTCRLRPLWPELGASDPSLGYKGRVKELSGKLVNNYADDIQHGLGADLLLYVCLGTRSTSVVLPFQSSWEQLCSAWIFDMMV